MENSILNQCPFDRIHYYGTFDISGFVADIDDYYNDKA